MKVAELIEKLEKYPQDAKVFIAMDESGATDEFGIDYDSDENKIYLDEDVKLSSQS